MRGSRVWCVALFAATMSAMAGTRSELGAQQQAVLVRGTVRTAGTSEPVASASVVVKGTQLGTQTDEKGAFTLRAPQPNATLVVSRIGYAPQEVPLAGRTSVDVSLTRTAVSLTEVVVVGYGTQKRSDITGSVASVSTAQLEEKPNTTLEQALQGAVPGVAITTTSAGAEPSLKIQVRGRNSISASTSPLVVVDGIPYGGDLAEINPNDIASIEILKDASATAIYGSRGSNGVVLVTSRAGNAGKPRLAYTGYVGRQQIGNLPTLMDAAQFADFKCVRLRTIATQPCTAVLTATELRNLSAGVNTDWARVGTHMGNQQQHDVSVAGGSDDTRYYLGASVLKTEGVALNDDFKRATVRFNLDQKVTSWARVGTNTQGGRSTRSGLPVNFSTAFFSNPLISPYDSAGRQLLIPWPEDPVTNNALENLLVSNDDVTDRLFSSNYLQITPTRIAGLSYRLNGGLELANRNVGTYYGRDTQTGLSAGGISRVGDRHRNDWTMENILKYTRAMGRHGVDLTALYSEQSNSSENDWTRGQGYPNDVLLYRSNLPLLFVPSDTVLESKLLSQMGRANYTYDERYLATVTVRRDGYSGFGRNNKYGVFPSLALGWNLSNEGFFPWKQSVDALKLRFSYGKNGNQAINPYQTLSQLDDRSYLNGDVSAPGYIPVTLGNPDLRWETTLSKNVGFDLSLWRERVRVTMDAYSANTSDLLLRRAISSVAGISSVTQNIGKTANKGVEMQLSTENLNTHGFQWSSDFNISANRNRIVDLYGDRTDDIASGWFIGQPIDVNYGYQFDGIWQTGDDITHSAQPTAQPGYVRIKDVNGDGKIDPLDRTFIGTLQPKYRAGLANTLRYRGLALFASLTSVQGITRSNQLLGTNQVFADVRRNTVFRQYWTADNPINTYPSNNNNSNPLSVPFYEDASYLRLKDLTLSYDLPARFASQFGGQSLRVYVNGRNLWTKTRWTGLDPELVEQRAVPMEKVVTGGLTVRF